MKPRYSAFLLHLLISGVIGLIAVCIVFFVWYPDPLQDAVGVTSIFLILLFVDIVIGPLLTLLVYKPSKPSLKFDLSVIALLQLVALCYGMNTVFQGRPAFIVYATDSFVIARAFEIDPDSAKSAQSKGNLAGIAGWGKPHWVAAIASPDPKRDQEILASAMKGGPDWQHLPELFVPLSQVKTQMLKLTYPLHSLRTLHGNDPNIIEELAHWQDNEVKWIPLRGKAKDMVVLVDTRSAEIIKVLDIKPWP